MMGKQKVANQMIRELEITITQKEIRMLNETQIIQRAKSKYKEKIKLKAI